MMKDGSRFFSGLEKAVFRNISSCKEFVETVQTCYGPKGMNKMVINHLGKHICLGNCNLLRKLFLQ